MVAKIREDDWVICAPALHEFARALAEVDDRALI
jgi:hypothetical protein